MKAKKQMFKNIIFDWSGVINDNQLTTFKVVNKTFNYFKLPVISYKEFRREWEQPYMLFYNKYLPDLTLTDENRVYKLVYHELVKYFPPTPYPGIVELINECNKDKELFIVSSNNKDSLLKEINDFGLKNVFNEVVASVHDKEDGLRSVVVNHHLELDKTIFIGDTAHEVEVGKKVGIKTGAVTWGIHSKARLKQANPNYLINNLKELEAIILH